MISDVGVLDVCDYLAVIKYRDDATYSLMVVHKEDVSFCVHVANNFDSMFDAVEGFYKFITIIGGTMDTGGTKSVYALSHMDLCGEYKGHDRLVDSSDIINSLRGLLPELTELQLVVLKESGLVYYRDGFLVLTKGEVPYAKI